MTKGLTLIELMVSVVILSFLTLCIFSLLNIGDLSWRTDMGLLDLQQQARQAMHGMVRELRQGINTSVNNVTITNGTMIEFYVYNVTNSIAYYLQQDRIIREHPSGTTRVLATDIDSISFCCCQQDTDCDPSECNSNCTFPGSPNAADIKIHITAGKTVKFRNLSFDLTEKVKLRNEE